MELVDQTGPYRVRGEFRTVNSDVLIGVGLEPPDRVGLELTFNTRPRAARLGEGAGINDLLGRLPLPRPVEHELRLVGNRVRGLPVDHCLVHPPSVEVGTFAGQPTVNQTSV